eukprot:6188836-Pleurochrysis_carterae.AAC.3
MTPPAHRTVAALDSAASALWPDWPLLDCWGLSQQNLTSDLSGIAGSVDDLGASSLGHDSLCLENAARGLEEEGARDRTQQLLTEVESILGGVDDVSTDVSARVVSPPQRKATPNSLKNSLPAHSSATAGRTQSSIFRGVASNPHQKSSERHHVLAAVNRHSATRCASTAGNNSACSPTSDTHSTPLSSSHSSEEGEESSDSSDFGRNGGWQDNALDYLSVNASRLSASSDKPRDHGLRKPPTQRPAYEQRTQLVSDCEESDKTPMTTRRDSAHPTLSMNAATASKIISDLRGYFAIQSRSALELQFVGHEA